MGILANVFYGVKQKFREPSINFMLGLENCNSEEYALTFFSTAPHFNT